MDAEIVLASSYAGFLTAVSAVLESTARYVHRRAQTSSTQGFTFIPEHDLWRCPTGQHLHRETTDQTFRIVRYRAQAHHCHNCPGKIRCTDSDVGRVLEHRPGSWLESGIRKFHRGMSLTLLLLAVMILVIELARHHEHPEQLFLTTFILCLGIVCLGLANSLRTSP
jgi:hypothetical protein